MKKYEYKVLELNVNIGSNEIESIMNDLGEKGWELVSSSVYTGDPAYYVDNDPANECRLFFKREKE